MPPSEPGPTAHASSPRLLLGRLGFTLASIALLTSACVNQGFDEDPPELSSAAISEGSNEDDAASGAAHDGDETGADDTATDGDGLPVGAVADPASLASIEEATCSFDELIPLTPRPTCYLVSVPENWAEPDPEDQVLLQVAVFEADPAAYDEADRSATIYLDGGPGASTLDLLWTSYGQLHEPLAGPRDYIMFDQRGVGTSEPLLSCPELADLELARLAGELSDEDEGPATLDAVTNCRDRLVAGGADLAAYNSVASANDIEAIRALLGYPQLNLVGVSYGTRLAQTHMRLYPGSVRSVVLDSIVPVEADLWTNLAAEAQGAFEQLFAGCAADAACAATYPDLESRFFALLDRLDAEPIEVEFRDLLTGDGVQAVVDGDELIGLVFSALYDQSVFSVVPAMVAEVENGDHRTVEFMGSLEVTNLPYAALGQRLSVECNEELAFEDESALDALAPTDPGYDRLGTLDGDTSFFDLCRAWPAGEAPEAESQPVVSDIPALLLGGSYDPITRPGNTEVVAASLANSFAFVLPHEGHGIVSSDCGVELVLAFLDEPMVEPDGGCLLTSPAPPWVPDTEAEEITLVEFRVEEPFAVSGVRPAGWMDAGAGVFARQRTALDPTTLIVQPTGGVVPEFVIDLLGAQLEVEFAEMDSLELDGRTWAAYGSDDDPDQVVRLAATEGRDGVMVVLVASVDEIDALYDEVFLPALGAATAG